MGEHVASGSLDPAVLPEPLEKFIEGALTAGASELRGWNEEVAQSLTVKIAAKGVAGLSQLRAISRRCEASSVAGVTSRLSRRAAGSSRASAARIARSDQSRLGRATWRRSTITSWRSTMISASLDARLRPSKTSQPKT